MHRTSPSRRRALGPLATMLAAAAIATASGATFTASTSSAGNSFATGTLQMTKSNAVIFTGANLKPGDSVSGSVTITNSGSLPATYTMSETATNPFGNNAGTEDNYLNIVVKHGSNVVFSGDLGEFGSQPLGNWAAGEVRTFDFVVSLDLSAPDSEQNKQATATYTWNAVQVDNGVAY